MLYKTRPKRFFQSPPFSQKTASGDLYTNKKLTHIDAEITNEWHGGFVVQWYDSRFECERSRVQILVASPIFFNLLDHNFLVLMKRILIFFSTLQGPITHLFTKVLTKNRMLNYTSSIICRVPWCVKETSICISNTFGFYLFTKLCRKSFFKAYRLRTKLHQVIYTLWCRC